MGQKTNILELNGKQYDAITGELLHAPKTSKVIVSKPVGHHGPRTIDDVRRTSHGTPAAHPSQPLPKVTVHQSSHAITTPTIPPKKSINVKRAPASHVKPHKQEHSKTLMRYAVKKPTNGLKRNLKVLVRTDTPVKHPTFNVIPKHSYYNVDPSKVKHAEKIAKSKLISRFSNLDTAAPVAQAVHKAVHVTASDREHIPVRVTATKPVAAQPVKHNTTHTQVVSSPATFQPTQAHQPKTATQPSLDIFEKALATANSHEQPPIKLKKSAFGHTKKANKPKRGLRATALTTGALAFVVFGGFIAYQHTDTINMCIASAGAGFAASLPDYSPTGFAAQNFEYSPGAVAVSYKSDGQAGYNVTQKISNWNSEALRENFVLATQATYRTVEANGRTVYIYGNNDASWIDNGVWYEVTNNGVLSDTEIAKLASSL